MSRSGNMEHDQLRMLGYTSISGNCFTLLISHILQVQLWNWKSKQLYCTH